MIDGWWLATLATKSLALGVTVSALEFLACRGKWPDDRLLARPGTGRTERLVRIERVLLQPKPTLAVVVARLVAAVVCLALPITHPAVPWLLGCLVAAQAFHNRRFVVAIQGADTMFLVGLAAMCAASLDPADASLRGVALAFMGAQVQVAYLTAALNKLRAPTWRDGRRLTAIAEAGPFRIEPLGSVLARRPAFAVVSSWTVMLLELLLPLSVLLPTPAFHLALAAGVAFHVLIAVFMGLYTFLWAFVAAYPGLYVIHEWLH